jgi:hypothetical protein
VYSVYKPEVYICSQENFAEAVSRGCSIMRFEQVIFAPLAADTGYAEAVSGEGRCNSAASH